MAKKDKKGENTVQNREIFQRMNFLYQAAMCMATITTPQPAPSNNKSKDSQPSTTKENHTATDTTARDPEPQDSIALSPPVKTASATTTTTAIPAVDVDMENRSQPPRKLSRKKTRKMLRERKNRIAMEQISDHGRHHRLTNSVKGHDPRPLSGTARFYASTLIEVGRKNVIRIRYFCMPGKGIEGDRWEFEETIGDDNTNVLPEDAMTSTSTSTATTPPAEAQDAGNDNAGVRDS
ncbi:hypothetical protein BGX23_008765, partial [Mortierella sp. AD031]